MLHILSEADAAKADHPEIASAKQELPNMKAALERSRVDAYHTLQVGRAEKGWELLVILGWVSAFHPTRALCMRCAEFQCHCHMQPLLAVCSATASLPFQWPLCRWGRPPPSCSASSGSGRCSGSASTHSSSRWVLGGEVCFMQQSSARLMLL